MKTKKLLVMLVMVLTAMSANAQFDPGKWSMQFKLGLGASQLTNLDQLPLSTTTPDTQWKGVNSIGLDFEYQATKWLGISAGFGRISQGGAWKDYTEGNVKYNDPEIDVEYLRVPIVANFYFYKGWAVKTGIQLGYLLDADFSQHWKENVSNRDLTTKQTLDLDDDITKFDVSIPVGISYESSGHFVFDARYNIGLTKVNDGKDLFTKDVKNGAFVFTIGYKFEL